MLLLKKLSSGQKIPEGINRDALKDIPAHGHMEAVKPEEAPEEEVSEPEPAPTPVPPRDAAMDALFSELDFPDSTPSSTYTWNDDIFDD
jgi:hypothetical protein